MRTGLFVGGFSGIYLLLHGALAKLRGEEKKSNSVIAASLAGLSLLFETEPRRKEIAHNLFFRLLISISNPLWQLVSLHLLILCLYLGFRAAHCVFLVLISRKIIPPIPNGNSLMFIFSSAQVSFNSNISSPIFISLVTEIIFS